MMECDMMDSKTTRTAAVLLCFIAGVALAGAFTWDGGVSSGQWSNENSWESPPFCQMDCWPRTTDDDATIDRDGNVTAEFTTDVEIDDLNISNSGNSKNTRTFFTEVVGGATLKCDTITISGGANADTEAVVQNYAKITTVDE